MTHSQTAEDITVEAPANKNRRILSFDIIRGFLLLVILVGHIELPPNFYDFFTGRGRLYVSAAEGFFFLSGLLIGMVYRRRLANGMRFIFKKMWTRAAELYVGSVFFTLLFSYIVAKTNHFYIKQGLPNPVDWPHIIIQTLLLRFDYGWADFLSRFAILMLIAPIVFYFIAKGRWRLVLLVIIAAYILRHDNFTLGWQIIFNSGMLIGFYWNEINHWLSSLSSRQKSLIKNSLITVTAITFTISYATVYILSELNFHYNALSPGWQHFAWLWDRFTNYSFIYADKWTMGPLRVILFFVWASVVYMIVTRYETQINARTKGVLLVIGQNSLFVYIFHAIVVFIFKYFIPAKTNSVQNFLIVSLALAIVISGTYLYRHIRLSSPQLNSAKFYTLIFRKGKALFAAR